MWLRMKNFNIFLGSLKNPIFRWGMGGCLQKNNIEGGDYLKRGGGLGLFADLRWWGGTWQEREGDVFEG